MSEHLNLYGIVYVIVLEKCSLFSELCVDVTSGMDSPYDVTLLFIKEMEEMKTKDC